MELGMIGLGKMGGFMAERLVRGGHRVVGFDRDAAAVQRVAEKGAGGADSLEKLIGQLKAPRAVWLMVPAGAPVDQTIDLLTPHLVAGRHDHRRRKLLLQGFRSPRRRAEREKTEFCGLRHQRRRLGPHRRLQHDDRRRCRCREASLADFSNVSRPVPTKDGDAWDPPGPATS